MVRHDYIMGEREKSKMKKEIKIFVTILLGVALGWMIAAGIDAWAEEQLTEAWVLCQPDSWVNIRSRASSKSESTGTLFSGDRIWIDGKTKDGFAHVDKCTTEAGEGWVHAGYIVFDEPELICERCKISSNGRVAARRTIDGQIRRWMQDGDAVGVIQVAGEWALTDMGFIKTEYILFGGTEE